ncbi:MAG: alkene reductase [Deltaproteobacteria bacterium]|nr:alkene reductase [Deltaproteobacteria bacterium]
MSNKLFSPFTLGRLTLKNRVVMAPMTRSRADAGVPTDIMATYYGQRAGAGLIITEGTSPSANGLGYARIPGLYNAAQVAGWRKVTDAVKAGGGAIFVQLMHCGRIGHPSNFVDAGARLIAPSALAAPGTMYTDTAGPQEHPVPEAMTEADIHATIQEYADSAALAIEAGFDGVELHGANGYLIDQFLGLASNHRADGWGGSVKGRIRFAVEVARAVSARIGADRVGMRVSPYGVFNGQSPEGDADHEALFTALAKELSALKLAYIHVVDHQSMGAPPVSASVKASIRAAFDGPYMLSGGYDAVRAEADLAANLGELVAFGRPYLSNPRLVEKLQSGEELLPVDFSTLYTPGVKGYIDYPV